MTAALAFALKHWKVLAGGFALAVLGLWLAIAMADARHWHRKYDAEAAAHALTVANVRRATAEARAEDEAHARAVQTADANISKETNDAIQGQRVAADRAVADYIRLHHAPAACGGGQREAGVSAAAGSAAGIDEAGSATVVPAADLSICASNTLTAEGWQSWWAQVSSAPR